MPSRPLIISSPSPLPTPSHTQSHLPITTAGIFTLLLTLLLCCRRKLSVSRTAPSDSKPPHRYSYATLRRATSSFSATLRLGQGGFGSVYLATLPTSPPTRAAVKLLDSGSLQGEREFHNELFLASKIDSRYVVSLLGFASKRRDMMLVYEYMSNGSLQDALLNKKCGELRDWNRRFLIVVDVARGIEYLHCNCDPPIVHCDIKPSNVLLDEDFRAKIGDFGLARVKEASVVVVVEEEEVVVGAKKLKCEIEGKVNGVEDCGSVMDDAESVTTMGMDEFSICVDQSPENFGRDKIIERSDEIVDVSPGTNVEAAALGESPTENNNDGDNCVKEINLNVGNIVKDNGKGKRSVSGRDWWWKQENGVAPASESGGVVKDYVMEWIGSEIKKERPKSDWIGSSSSKKIGKSEKNKSKKRLEWWVSLDEEKKTKKEKRKPAREWWKEEYCDELAKKKKKKKIKRQSETNDGINNNSEDNWWPTDDSLYVDKKKKSKSRNRNSRGSIDWWMDGFSGELWKGRGGNSQDSMSGGMSSTPSMRGTMCYIAPEYGGNDNGLSEKCDVYSFGVLLLVIIAGRRPLQVSGSPLSEFQRANLLSWARKLARAGKLIDLVDKSMESLNQEQALLCIRVALLCLQRLPARRPSIKEVLGMILGESEPPQLPYEFSPSPPSRFPFKSQKKVR